MSDIQEITKHLIKFRDDRDWDQFHNPKDLAIALNIEAGELLEVFLWKSVDDADVAKVKDELADVFSFAFLIANKYGFDVSKIIQEKITKNALKYPIEKSKGSNKKYNEI
ncbi:MULTISPECIES: nucleotide pyrophosphohydrolase [Methylotenera]|jgi:NTP pyrophosphatase (non-canonical NTP hydrolase)|uniref:nucleotide pyrophosphohydrolase n=1 Tax=Methylotenera TaxID=359407 RepID=UPI00037D60FA|nr:MULTISPECIES: nucleotide pyrophosphohydrolase [Methylotenera]